MKEKALNLFSIMLSVPYLIMLGVGTLIQGTEQAIRGKQSMIFERFTNIFIEIFSVIAVRVFKQSDPDVGQKGETR